MLQYVNAVLFLILTVMYTILAIINKQTDLDRFEKDEADMEEYHLKQEFKSNPSGFYMQQMKEK